MQVPKCSLIQYDDVVRGAIKEEDEVKEGKMKMTVRNAIGLQYRQVQNIGRRLLIFVVHHDELRTHTPANFAFSVFIRRTVPPPFPDIVALPFTTTFSVA